jgi:uncharacterized protein (TIGR02246 family)
MLPHQPEDWPLAFERHLNAGDLDAVMELYELDARFVEPASRTIVGHGEIRKALANMIRANTQLKSQVIQSVTVGDIALLHTDFHGTTVDEFGATVESHFKAIEILRRQPDGAWKLIIGDPNARG